MPDEVQRRRTTPIVDSLLGALVAAAGATGASMISVGHKWESSVPLIFVGLLLVISEVFGARAGVLGTIIAALIFAAFLFRPMGKLEVGSDVARANLAWMLLAGISFSFLFAPQNSSFHRH